MCAMKLAVKVLKAGGILLFVAIAAILFFGNTDFYTGADPSIRPSRAASTQYQSSAKGTSMEPAIRDGQGIVVDVAPVPRTSDIVALDCLEVCYYKDYYSRNEPFVKRLIIIREDGAWWVEGDNKENSWDSVDYGWILPSQRANVGVVVEILK